MLWDTNKNPKILDESGSKIWYNEDKQHHREDGPAIIHPDGTKFWYINGKCHRLNGPAAIYHWGYQSWWVNGIEYTEEEYNDYLDSKIKLVFIMLRV